jgi:hypothetical protein
MKKTDRNPHEFFKEIILPNKQKILKPAFCKQPIREVENP